MGHSAEKGLRRLDRDALMTWPDFTIQLHVLPWHWRMVPRGWVDYSPKASASAGWWGIDGEWLFLKVSFGFNLPPFTSLWAKPGCDCTELCSMGPTCPGGMLAGLPGSGCWRSETTVIPPEVGQP